MNQQAMPSAPSLRTSPVVGVEDVHAVDLHLDPRDLPVVPADREDVDVRLAEDDEQVALAGVLQVVGHVEVGVHARLEDRDAAERFELRRVGVVVEGAGDQDVEAGVPASRAAATRSGRDTVPNSGPMKIPARFSGAGVSSSPPSR